MIFKKGGRGGGSLESHESLWIRQWTGLLGFCCLLATQSGFLATRPVRLSTSSQSCQRDGTACLFELLLNGSFNTVSNVERGNKPCALVLSVGHPILWRLLFVYMSLCFVCLI